MSLVIDFSHSTRPVFHKVGIRSQVLEKNEESCLGMWPRVTHQVIPTGYTRKLRAMTPDCLLPECGNHDSILCLSAQHGFRHMLSAR